MDDVTTRAPSEGAPFSAMRSRLRIAAIGLRGLPSSYSGLERSSEGLLSLIHI